MYFTVTNHGVFKPKIPIWVNFGGSCNGIFYDHLVYFTAIRNILWPCGIFVVIGYIFPHFGMLYQEKSGNPVTNAHLAD
jgi:hypothetical protein